MKAFPLIRGTRQGCPLLLLLFNKALNFLAKAFRQKKEIEDIQIAKDNVKLSIYDMILDTENTLSKSY